MKKHLLIGTTVLALALSATSIYAQVVSGTSIVDKMKAVAHSFTLSTELNAGQTGLTSEPVKGKKTGDILTAGEWNRMLEIVSQGGTGGSSPMGKASLDTGWLNYYPTPDPKFTDSTFGAGSKKLLFSNFTHNLGGNKDNYVVDVQYEQSESNGGTSELAFNNPGTLDAVWNNLTTTSININNMHNPAPGAIKVRIRIWDTSLAPASAASTSGYPALYKCTNAQSADSTNAPCYGASRNGGAGTNQYRVISCTDNDGIRSYTMSSILNFGNLVANKWSVSVNGGTIECDDGTVLVMDITGSSSVGTSPSNIVYINPDNTDFVPLDCTPGVNYMINPIAFSAVSASSFTTQKVAVLGAGSWQVKGTGFTRIRNKDSDYAQALRVSSVIDGTTTHLLDSSVDAGMYANSFLDPVSVPSGKTAELRASVKNNTLHGGNIVAWCN